MVKKSSGSFIIGFVLLTNLAGWFVFAQDIPLEAETASSEPGLPGEPGMVDLGVPGREPGSLPSGQPGQGPNPAVSPSVPGMPDLPMEPGNLPAEVSTLPGQSSGLAPESGQADLVEPEQEFNESFSSSDIKDITGAGGKERISLDLRSINIIEIFKILSIKTNKNIIPTPSVRGRVNLYLNNVTFDDALDVILISQNLAADQRGGVLVIMTEAEYKALYGRSYNETKKVKSFKLKYAPPSSVFKALDSLKSTVGKIIVDAESGTVILIDTPEAIERMYDTAMKIDKPLENRAFELQYADAEDIKPKLEALITDGVGKVTIDERTNSVILTDLPKKIVSLSQALRLFDEETRAVFIQAEILEVELRDRYQYGVNWERFMSAFQGLHLTSTFPAASTLTQNQTLVFGDLEEKNFKATLQFLNTLGDTRILSRPNLAVVNNAEASIMVGTREVYSTSSISQSTDTTVTSESIEFIDVGVKLNVTPTINADGFITMKIKPEVSSVVDTYTTANSSTIPIVQTSESSTTVKIRDGEMIMIAGLMKDTKSHTSFGVPLLNKIPFIGAIFGSRDSDVKRKEIIVFITPHIMDGNKQRTWDKKQLERYPDDFIVEDAEGLQVKAKEWKLKDMKSGF